MSLSVEIVGLNELINDVRKAGGDAKPLVKAALTNSSGKIQSNVRQRAPHRTGALQRSVLNRVDYPTATVEVQESYGDYIEHGTRPHVILPKKKQALFWNGALNPYKSVHHPGTKARPFFAPGVEASQEYISEQFDQVMQKLINELAGHR